MNCTQFRKYCGAFADGELDVKLNLESLEHLNMCPACAARVDEIRGLKAALVRVFGSERPPQRLQAQVLDALADIARESLREQDAGPVASWRRPRLLIPLAAAAVVLFYIALWQRMGSPELPTGAVTVVNPRLVNDVALQHGRCRGRMAWGHHDNSLSWDLPHVAQSLGRRLNMNVLVPDLDNSGFDFVGAERCDLQERPAAHVLYAARQSFTALSIFSLHRVNDLSPNRHDLPGMPDCYVGRTDTYTVVAWHDNAQTYAVCGSLPESRLVKLTEDMHVAGLFPTAGSRPMLASARH